MLGLWMFLLSFLIIFPFSFFDVQRVSTPFSFFNKEVWLFFLGVLKSFFYFFISVSIGCSLACMPVFGLLFVVVHDCVLRRHFLYRYYSIFAIMLGFLLFFVPALVLLIALTFGLSFLFLRSGYWALIAATSSVPCLGYVLYSYVFFKFLVLLSITVLGLHYWQVKGLKNYRLHD